MRFYIQTRKHYRGIDLPVRIPVKMTADRIGVH